MVCNYNRYHSENTTWGISHMVNSKDDVEFAMLSTASGKPGDIRFCVVKGLR